MVKAIWNGQLIAESDETIRLEGNYYFPIHSVNRKYLQPSDAHTTCFWKGIASYYDLRVGEAVNPNAAWYYPDPSERADGIRDHIAFWHGVEIIDGES
jgi:uncharacterized protein (DUF427 family)